jgi:ABC-2 type transport system permease protein
MVGRLVWLLKLEWLKFKNLRVFRALAIAYTLLLMAGLLVFKAMPELPGETFLQDLFAFPVIWKWLGYGGNWLSFFCLGFMGILSVTTEFTNRTARQNLITGLRRDDFLKSKVLFLLAVAMAATVVYVLVGFAYGLLHSKLLSAALIFGSAGPWVIGRYFLMCLGYLTLGLSAGFLFRKSGLTIFAYIIYVSFGELFIRWVIHLKVLGGGRSMVYYPANALGYIMPVPIGMDELAVMTRESGIDFIMRPTEAAVTVIVYTVLMIGGSWLLVRKRDF